MIPEIKYGDLLVSPMDLVKQETCMLKNIMLLIMGGSKKIRI